MDDRKSGRDWMHRCQHCGTVTPPHTSAERVVVETRLRSYPLRHRVMRETVWKQHLMKRERADDSGGTGREIVRELIVCPPCKRALAADVGQQHA